MHRSQNSAMDGIVHLTNYMWSRSTSRPQNPPSSSLPGDSSAIRSSQYPDWRIIDLFFPLSLSWGKSALLSRMSYADFLPSAHDERYPCHSVKQQLIPWCPIHSPLTPGLLPGRLFLCDCCRQTPAVFGGSRPSFLWFWFQSWDYWITDWLV